MGDGVDDRARPFDDLDQLSRSDPRAIPARLLGLLRRSPDPRARAAAARVHALRRPRSYLRTIDGWWADDSEAVRATCMEGLGLAAVLEGLAGEDRPELERLLARGGRDASPIVRTAAEEASWLLAPVNGDPLPPAA
jgi:hypothetical protein